MIGPRIARAHSAHTAKSKADISRVTIAHTMLTMNNARAMTSGMVIVMMVVSSRAVWEVGNPACCTTGAYCRPRPMRR